MPSPISENTDSSQLGLSFPPFLALSSFFFLTASVIYMNNSAPSSPYS
jgi:hypothetical protein